MSAQGLDVFDKTLQTTHIWLNEIGDQLIPDRQLSWRVLGVVLRAVRDRLPTDLSAHLGAELPLLVRGAYSDQFRPSAQPMEIRDLNAFLEHLKTLKPAGAKGAFVFGGAICSTMSPGVSLDLGHLTAEGQ